MSQLIILFAIPFISAFAAFIFPNALKKSLKTFASLCSLLPLVWLLYHHASWVGSRIDYDWASQLSIRFQLSIDALSLLFLYLTAVIIPVVIISQPAQNLTAPRLFYSLVLLLQGFLIGFFTARDLAVFTLFWEAMLLPLYFAITIWGGHERRTAGLKFLIYMIAGSALMIAAVLLLYFASASGKGAGTFNLDLLSQISASAPHAKWILAIFLLAFAVKTPLFPFHAWLPDAYTQASTSGTILLSALLSKAGIYGIIRVGMGLFPELLKEWSPHLLGLSIVGVFYGGFAAWMQNDFKRLIAYSSFSHVNFILAGLFIWEDPAHLGAVLQAFNHGVTITALFLVASWLEYNIHSTAIGQMSGLAKFLPKLCWLTLFFVLSNVALPGLNNFVGELLILFGLFKENPYIAAVLAATVILSAIYMLRWMQKMYFETPRVYETTWMDVNGKQFAIALPLIGLILWFGIYPAPIIKQLKGQTIVNITLLEPVNPSPIIAENDDPILEPIDEESDLVDVDREPLESDEVNFIGAPKKMKTEPLE